MRGGRERNKGTFDHHQRTQFTVRPLYFRRLPHFLRINRQKVHFRQIFTGKFTIHFRPEQQILAKFIPRALHRKLMNHLPLRQLLSVALQIRENQAFAVLLQHLFHRLDCSRGTIIIEEVVAISPFRHFEPEAILPPAEVRHEIFTHLCVMFFDDGIERSLHIARLSRCQIEHLRRHGRIILDISLGKKRRALFRHRIIGATEHKSQHKIGRIEREPTEIIRIVLRRLLYVAHPQCRVPIEAIHFMSGSASQQTHFQRIVTLILWGNTHTESPCHHRQEANREESF